MKIVKKATTTKELFANEKVLNSSCCGSDCILKCKKCPPMKD